MALFRNFYRCARCQNKWTDVRFATCDDDCPARARHMSPYKSEDTGGTTQTELAGSGAGAIGDRSLPRALLACYEDGETELSSMSYLYIWALSHGCSAEELSDTAYMKFRHDEASEQVESAAGNGYVSWLDREWTNGASGNGLRH